MKRNSIHAALGAVSLSLLVSGCCFGPGEAFSPLCAPFLLGKGQAGSGEPLASDFQFALEDDSPGVSSAQRASCQVPAGAPQLASATFAYPPGFSVSPDGFLATGESPAGRYIVELDTPAAPVVSFPVIASGRFSAWADLNEDGRQDFWEPEIFRSQAKGGGPLLRIDTPFDGDDNAMVHVANVGFRATVELASGIFVNPDSPGTYEVSATFQGVDPATGGPPIGGGGPPVEITLAAPVEVGRLLKDGFESRL